MDFWLNTKGAQGMAKGAPVRPMRMSWPSLASNSM
jgi:hypothetical protein